MKGRFSLNWHSNEYGHRGIIFGNLGKIHGTGFHFLVDEINLHDMHKHHKANVQRLIAHDVMDHVASHRTKETVSFEAEFRALGAACFSRDAATNIMMDITSVMSYMGRECLPPPPINVPDQMFATVTEVEEALDDTGCKASRPSIRKALDQMNYGYWQKTVQYNDNDYKAFSDYEFIRENSIVLFDILREEPCSGVSVYFDTDMKIFRTQLKHQY